MKRRAADMGRGVTFLRRGVGREVSCVSVGEYAERMVERAVRMTSGGGGGGSGVFFVRVGGCLSAEILFLGVWGSVFRDSGRWVERARARRECGGVCNLADPKPATPSESCCEFQMMLAR